MTLLEIRARTPGSVSARIDELGDRPVVVIESDAAESRGALLPADGETMAEAARFALRNKLPLVAFLASSGADLNEGLPAIHGWGTAARTLVECSGKIPLLFAVTGPAVSGPALLIGLADVVIMTSDAYAFVSGPGMVRQFTGVTMDVDTLGGASVHATASGAAALVVADRAAAADALAHLVSLLPSNSDDEAPRIATDDPPERPTPELVDVLPSIATASYDVRHVIESVVDDGVLLELRPGWATNLVTALGTVDGRPVGIVANQPQAIAGTLDIPSSQKGARFVAFCDAFNLPLITFVDTPGFYPGKDLEWRGMIRHGAQLAFSYARATVPRVCVTLRKSYGGAYIVMDSKHMGNDIHLAWPSAEIAVMGAEQAAGILMRRATDQERIDFIADYEERLLNPYVAARRGSVDQVIDPVDTRREVCAALDVLATKRERLSRRRHDNTPL